VPRAGWLAAGAIVGALVAATASALICLVAAGAALLLAAAVGRRRGRWPTGAALIALGAALLLVRAVAGYALDAGGPGQAGTATTGTTHSAHVVSVGSTDGGEQRLVLELEPPEAAERIYAWLPRYPALSAFDRISFNGELEQASGDDSFAQYLARSGIEYTVRVSSFELLGSTDTPLAALEHTRRTMADLLARVVPQPQAGLAAGLLVGLRDQVARDVTGDFRVAGLSHIVAISGAHLALIAGLAAALLARLGRRRRSLILLALVWAYALLAGAGPSVVRAALMMSVVIAARESGRASRARGALALTALLMLLVEPAVVADVGFELSLAATAGILVWSKSFGQALRRRLPRRTPAVLIDGLGMSLAAQLATQPLVLLHFGQLSLVAPLANLLAAPLVAPAMLSSAAVLPASAAVSVGAPDLIAVPFAVVAAGCVGALIAVAHVCAALPLASLSLAPPLNLLAAVSATAGIAVLLRRRLPSQLDAAATAAAARRSTTPPAAPSRRWPRRWGLALVGSLVAVLLSALAVSAAPDGRLHMTVLDVGQGDSILLEGPAGGRILIDTGPDPDRLLALLDSRLPVWDRRLDVVVITHPHEDHVAGMALLLDRYRIGEIAEPGMIGLGPGDAAFRRRLADLGRQTRLLAAGDRLFLDHIELDVLWPPPGGVPLHPSDGGAAVNNVSIVLEMQYGSRRFLLGGDIEQQIDPQLLHGALAADDRPYDVLKVAHHGSATASTQAFLDRVKPKVAIVSAGWGNPYGHPAPDTIDRLKAAGAQVFRTDLDGSVSISTDGHDLRTAASGGRSLPSTPAAYSAPPIGWCPIAQPVAAIATQVDAGAPGG
jgi:competence protein ComEC